jgi:hypothetical protein
MKNFAIAMGLLLLAAGSPVWAQGGGGGGGGSGGAGGGSGSASSSMQAPIGHRQPRASDFRDERNLSNPNAPANKEDAALDKKIKSICRGC